MPLAVMLQYPSFRVPSCYTSVSTSISFKMMVSVYVRELIDGEVSNLLLSELRVYRKFAIREINSISYTAPFSSHDYSAQKKIANKILEKEEKKYL